MEDGDSGSVCGIWTLVSAVFWSLFTWPAVSSRRKKFEIKKRKIIIEVYGEHRCDLLCACVYVWSFLFPTSKLPTVLLIAVGFSGASPGLQ